MTHRNIVQRMRRAPMTTAMVSVLLSATMFAGCSQQPADDAATIADGASGDVVAPTEPAPAAAAAADAASAAGPAGNENAASDAPSHSSNAANDAAAIPGTSVAAGAGVALTYSFAFHLADDQVAEAQDRHLRACERLGPARCQVTDILFDREANGPINAHLLFLLDPSQARSFARDAVDAVESLDGAVSSSTVQGEELARGIETSQAAGTRMGGDISRLERRLAAPGIGKDERDEIRTQVEQLRGEMSSEQRGRRTSGARLATTPVRFDYSGNTGIAGIDSSRPFSSAWTASTSSLATASAFALTLLGIVLPWLLMIGGGVFGIRWLFRRVAHRPAPVAD